MTVKTRTDRLIRQMKKPVVKSQPELKVPVGGSFFLPNQSGDHSQGVVTQAPVNDIDIPNKAYVDASGGEWTKDIPNTYLKPNTDGYAIRLYDSAGTDYGFIKSDGTYLDITSVGEHIRITSGGGFIFLLDDMDSRNIRPSSSSNFDLGLDSRVWENAHFEEVHIYDSTGAEHATITRDLISLHIDSGTGGNTYIYSAGAAKLKISTQITAYANISPNADDSRCLGGAGEMFGTTWSHRRYHGVVSGITASTTQTQGQGALVDDVSEIAVCANVNDTVTLPVANARAKRIMVINNGAFTLKVYPATGDDIDKAGVNVATTMGSGCISEFICYDDTNWVEMCHR